MSEAEQNQMDAANAAFSLAFLLEAALKLAALGLQKYLGDGLNCFDLLLVLLSVVELLLEVGRLGGGWWVQAIAGGGGLPVTESSAGAAVGGGAEGGVGIHCCPVSEATRSWLPR